MDICAECTHGQKCLITVCQFLRFYYNGINSLHVHYQHCVDSHWYFILMNKIVFELSYNILKYIVQMVIYFAPTQSTQKF